MTGGCAPVAPACRRYLPAAVVRVLIFLLRSRTLAFAIGEPEASVTIPAIRTSPCARLNPTSDKRDAKSTADAVLGTDIQTILFLPSIYFPSSTPSYALVGFNDRDPGSNEAGMKYLLSGEGRIQRAIPTIQDDGGGPETARSPVKLQGRPVGRSGTGSRSGPSALRNSG